LIAGAVLWGPVLAQRRLRRLGRLYRAYFPFAGGLEPGAPVRYAGGPQVGRVESVQLDPADPARIEITFSVRSGLPVKTDSHVRIAALSLLGDNHLEIGPGSERRARPAGIAPAVRPYFDFSSLTSRLGELAPQAAAAAEEPQREASALKVTVDRVNDLVGDENRASLAGTLAEPAP
jgi:phospholipid/cholesterol/gamma-HCH transport system substrate-binding protein